MIPFIMRYEMADHVTLPFISGRQGVRKKVAILHKNCLIFSIFGNLLVPELIIKG